MSLRIYISHASEDQAHVNRLRDELKAKAFQVFLCEDLPAGSDWQKEMDQELRQADLFIYCLSNASVARSGLYNDELKAARARYRTEGERAISIVPLRLEPCLIPGEVKDLMALDLFPAGGLKRLLDLLCSRTHATSRHVFLLHGIKTRGKWQKDVSPLLSAKGSFQSLWILVTLELVNWCGHPLAKRKSSGCWTNTQGNVTGSAANRHP